MKIKKLRLAGFIVVLALVIAGCELMIHFAGGNFGGIGWTTEDSYLPIGSPSLAWKWTAGSRTMLQKISFRGELSYLNKSDYMIGMYVGLPVANKDSKY